MPRIPMALAYIIVAIIGLFLAPFFMSMRVLYTSYLNALAGMGGS